MHVWLAAMRFVDLRDGFGGQDDDGNGLDDSGLAVVAVGVEVFCLGFVVGERE